MESDRSIVRPFTLNRCGQDEAAIGLLAVKRWGSPRLVCRLAGGAALAALLAMTAGCPQAEISEYHVPKGSEHIVTSDSLAAAPADNAAGMASSPAGQRAGTGGIGGDGGVGGEAAGGVGAAARWVLPSGWRELDESRPMRLASFVIEDQAGPVEVAVTRFPGDTGGVLANVNRWRGQIGLGPVAQADLDSLLTPFESPGFDGYVLHLEGPTQHMLVASIFEPAANRTWFVRVVADQAVAQRVKPEVFAFARSFGTARSTSDTQEQQ